jgi:hypothetical protein
MSEDSVGRRLETIGDIELISEMLKHFGGERFAAIIGWATIAGIISEVTHKGDPAALRKEMEARGMTTSAIYRALVDLRKFGELLDNQPPKKHDLSMSMRVIERVRQVRVL